MLTIQDEEITIQDSWERAEGRMPVAASSLAREKEHARGGRWGIVLGGGDGTRLLGLTRLVSGDDRPKQFCSLFGGETLLEQTRKRAERSIPAEHVLFPLTSAHRAYYLREPGIRPSQRIVQPVNKGTAPPIAYSLLSIERQDSEAVVAVLPSDHHYSNEAAFTAVLESAFETARRHRDSVVLLGSPAGGAQTEYGWVETGPAVGVDRSTFHVQRFCEKPTLDLAERLYERGALWNTFVMVGHVSAFLNMVSSARSSLMKAFPAHHLWARAEVHIPDWIYERFYAADFSREILSNQTERLLVQRMAHVVWNDLGHPERVMDVLQAAGLKPWWMKEWHASNAGLRRGRPPGVEIPVANAAVA